MSAKPVRVINRVEPFYLSEILGTKIMLGEKKVGNLADLVIIDGELTAEVSHLYVSRPLGDPALVIPWDKVMSVRKRDIIIDIESVDKYVVDINRHLLLLKDYVLDKKVLDVEGKEVEVVYDVKLISRQNKLYVTEVDVGHAGLLRRMGLRKVADFISNLGEAVRAHSITWNYVQPLPPEIGSFEGNIRLKVLKEKLSEMHPVDVADVLEEMDHEQRMAAFANLETEQASDALEEIDPVVQKHIMAALTDAKIAQLVNEMTPGQAADVLSVLPSTRAAIILTLLEHNNAIKIQSILEKHEEKILNYATPNFLKVHPNDTVEQARDLYRRIAYSADVIMYFYIVDESDQLLGVADIRDILRADDNVLLKDVMDTHLTTLKPQSTLREASAKFSRYGYRALPVIDESGKVLGVVPYRDMMQLKHRFLE
ncbi:MAG TPA: CBS domain-containing protein [Dehalococcoidia bacterium]|nr:CBS domain-containing protein [Dehalococcoidia bacterium]